MGLFSGRNETALATISRRPFTCRVCGHDRFWSREVKLNSTNMEFLDLGWANRSATGVICESCGFVHEFVGDALELWETDGGYPPG